MKYYTILDGPSSDEIAPVYNTYSEQEILDMYWNHWYSLMCNKFGKECVDSNYSQKDCIDDWIIVNWAWESNDGIDR